MRSLIAACSHPAPHALSIRPWAVAAVAALVSLAWACEASAQTTTRKRAAGSSAIHAIRSLSATLNENTTTIISGNPNGTYLYLAYDMSTVLDDGDKLRVLPVIGKGGYQNVRDVLHLKGVDLGITQSNIMRYLKRTGEMGASIDKRLGYVAKLYNEEMHILAGDGILRLKDLEGKKVNFSDVGSGTQFSARLIFELLGIKPVEVNMGQSDGYLKVKSGEIAATVLIAGKPTGAFGKFKLEPGMKLLPVEYSEPLEEEYFPARLTHQDYPNLLKEGESVDTVAVGAVLAVYLWPRDTDRYRRVARFVEAFFSKFPEFRKAPRHSKWRETNLAADLKGWTRFPAAREWLDANNGGAAATAPAEAARGTGAVPAPSLVRQGGERRPATEAANKDKLYEKFLEWSKAQSPAAPR
ncbi:MAG: TAXI family TRAP transporter solute-binding subunit [Hyphomicrobiaceae bacterium]